MYLHKLNIGNVELKNNIITAPMAGVTDLPFRIICEKFEPGLSCLEMVSAKAIYYDDTKTKRLLDMKDEKRPISSQIFGSDGETMGYAASYISKIADIVDINMGCPAPKVVKNGDGSSLLQDLKKAEKIIKAVVENSDVPVTLKIRAGWDKDNIVATDIAKIAENNGISMITIHGRTRTEFYSGKADLNIIKRVKNAVSIPVIGNGDIVDGQSAKNMFEYTGVDGIMIGRGLLGNPWLIRDVKHFLKTGENLSEPTPIEKLQVIKEHINLVEKYKGHSAIKELRKHLAWYTKSLKNSTEFRSKINKIEDKNELQKTVEEYFMSL